MAGFLACSPLFRLPSQLNSWQWTSDSYTELSICWLFVSGNEFCRGFRTYSYGYSAVLSTASLLLTDRGNGTVTPYSACKDIILLNIKKGYPEKPDTPQVYLLRIHQVEYLFNCFISCLYQNQLLWTSHNCF